VLRGRLFADADSQNSEPVVILNEAAAARYFPGEDAVGKVAPRVLGLSIASVGIYGVMRLTSSIESVEAPARGDSAFPLVVSNY
jgi:hypothetical protein